MMSAAEHADDPQATTKTVTRSKCVMTEIVLPNLTNGLGNLMGGQLLLWMDKCAAISAARHANRPCVTAAVDSVEFHSPIRQKEIVVLESQVNRAFNTSMEVELNVWAENPVEETRRRCNRAYYTFVSIDDAGRPIPVSPIQPETDEEHERYEHAARRREFRLILAGRLHIDDARHIRDFLLDSIDRDPTDA